VGIWEGKMGIKDRKVRQKKQLRKKIIQTAVTMLLKDGYEKFSMRRLANKIEYSPTTIYLYFENKADLVFNVIEYAFSKFVERFEEIDRQSDNNPYENLRKGLRAYIKTALEYPQLYKIMLVIDYNFKKEGCYVLQQGTMNERAFSFLKNTINECLKQGKFTEEDIAIFSQIFWAAIHGLASLLITQPEFPWLPEDKLIDNLINTLMKTLEK
jgi:AcrR family transcriptional regulator